MKSFKIGKKCKAKDFNLVYGGWNGLEIGKGFVFYVIIAALYLLVQIKEVKLKNLYTSTCLNLKYGTTEQKPEMQWL